MSFGGKADVASKTPKVAGISDSEMSSNQQGVPLRYWTGYDWCPLYWISEIHNPVYKEIRTQTGKGKSTVTGTDVYGDLAALAGLGLVDEFCKIESDKEIVWEGSIQRPDDPDHPNYWRAQITTSVGIFYCYWGRADQPVDDILLGPLGASNPDLEHPAYRRQCLIICKNYYFGQGRDSAPNTRIYARRVPRPKFGTFPEQNSPQGESLVAAQLELATDTMFGGRLPEKRFNIPAWEALSADVISRAGCHSLSIDRERPLGDVINDSFVYYDGWARLSQGKITPGMYPHDGSVPSGLTELSHHDIVGKPTINAPGFSNSANSVVVKFRDSTAKLRVDSVGDSASANQKVRQRVQPVSVEMLAIIDREQAAAFASEASQTAAEDGSNGGFAVRRSKAKWANGDDLQAGDNFNLDYLPYELDQISRIDQRRDFYDGRVEIDYVAERGIYPAPYRPPADLTPTLGRSLPTEILNARILELTTELAGSPLGISVAVLAKRPPAQYASPYSALRVRSVIGFNTWYSADNATYDPVGSQTAWAVRGTLRADVAAAGGATTLLIAMDADNIDLDRISPLGSEDQSNDLLLAIIGDEVLSAGAMAVSGLNRDINCLRARQGTNPVAAAIGDPVWLVFRDELQRYKHKRFVEDQDRWFKLQPYTSSNALDLADITPLAYHFRDRADELPQIVIDALPGGLRVGTTFYVTGTIADVNGDLKNYQITAARLTGPGGTVDSEMTLRAGDFAPDDKALFTFKVPLVFPQDGTWRIIVRAYDERVGFTEVETAELTVVSGFGDYGPDDGITPDAINLATVVTTGGLNVIFIEWVNPTNTPIRSIRIYESATAVRPANPTAQVAFPQMFFVREGLGNFETRYFWLEVEAKNGRRSAITGPKIGITSTGIDLADLVPGMTMVGIVNSLPAGSGGKNVVLLTTDRKLYRWDATAGAWTRKTDGADIEVDSILVGALSAGAVTAYAVGTNLLITTSANIANAVINDAHIVNVLANKVLAGELFGMYLKTGKMSASYEVCHEAAPANTTSTRAIQIVEDGTHRTALAGLEIWMMSFSGWGLGASGYVEDRFVRENMMFECEANGGSTITPLGWIDEEIIFRVNGGATFQVNAYAFRSTAINGQLGGPATLPILGLAGTDVVEFGIRLTAGDPADQFNVCRLTVKARNI